MKNDLLLMSFLSIKNLFKTVNNKTIIYYINFISYRFTSCFSSRNETFVHVAKMTTMVHFRIKKADRKTDHLYI